MFKEQFRLAKYSFTLEAIDNINLPAYKGSTFHGGFGHALMRISPIWYQYFFEPGLNKKGDWPKPFVILPPLDELEHYAKGHQFHLELTLIGEATRHYAIAQAAIEFLGMQMGLGYEKGKYKIIDVVHSQPLVDSLENIPQLRLHLPTRLRLKANNRIQRKTPDFQLFVTRLLGRIKTLENAYMEKRTDSDFYHGLIHQAKNIKVENSQIKWDDWNRFSGSQKKWMKFGGLMGDITYAGDLEPFADVLKLGEWLHIGNKTSFGLGKYEIK